MSTQQIGGARGATAHIQEGGVAHRGGALPWLKERSATVRESLLARGTATAEQVAAYWPGGAENPERGAVAWAYCFANLFALRAAAEARTARAGGGSGGGRVEADDAAAEARVLAALRAEPEAVTLTTVDASGAPRVVYVHPKGIDALMALAARDVTITYLRTHLAALRADCERVNRVPDPHALELLPRVLAELAYQERAAVWIVTTKGAGLPYDPHGADGARPALPAWTDDLSAWDIVLILRAHTAVNATNVHALSTLIDMEEEATGRRPSWGVFLGAAAAEMNVRPETLMADWSLAALLASQRARAKAQRDAYADAEAAAKRKGARDDDAGADA